jgi:hypothetical protein
MKKGMMMKIDPNNSKLDRDGFDAIIEYLDHAINIYPDIDNELETEEIKELLIVQAHLFVIIKALLMHSDIKYRNRIKAEISFDKSLFKENK